MSEFVENDAELTLTLEEQSAGAIANNLTTTVEGYALDARQGNVLNDKKLDKTAVANNLTTDVQGYVLDARQGKWLNENKVGFSDVANDLNTDDPNKVLSAAQGYAMGRQLETMPTEANPLPISRGGTGASTAEAARVMLGAVHKVSMAVSIPVSYWSGSGPYRVGLNVEEVTASNDVLAEPDYSSREHYYDCGVGMVEQSQGVLVFTAQEKPTQTLLVNLLILT